jgi:glutathione S-transferase
VEIRVSYVLHGAILSPFVRKCRAYLAEKDIPYEHVHADPGNLPEGYERLNPLRRIPALEHGDLRLADSSVICQYLERLHPETPLYGDNTADYARTLWLEKYADYELAPVATFGIFRERLIMPLRGVASNEERAQRSLAALPALFDYLEHALGEREWFVGDQLTVADIAVASQFVNLEHAGEREALSAQRWPRLHAFVERMLKRPSFADGIEQERSLVGKIRHKLGLA